MDLDAFSRGGPQLVLVDELAHTHAPEESASQALHGCRGARRRDRRLYDAQHPACRKPQRHRRRNHQYQRSRDGAGFDHRSRRRHRADRPYARGSDRTAATKARSMCRTRRSVPSGIISSPGNLTALRELALRRTAQRVDAQMVDYMRAHRIAGSWPASERVLACLVEFRARRQHRRAPGQTDGRSPARRTWTAVHVETPAAATARRGRRATGSPRRLRLAQRLGASGYPSGSGCRRYVAEYAQSNNFTHIIIAQPPRPRWRGLSQDSLTQQLIRKGGGAGVHVLGRNSDAAGPFAFAARPPCRLGHGIRRVSPLSPSHWARRCCYTRCWGFPAWR